MGVVIFRLGFLRVFLPLFLVAYPPKQFFSRHSIVVTSLCSLEMPKDELPNHNCIKHLRSVVQQQQTRIAELEKTSAEHKHQLAEQVLHFLSFVKRPGGLKDPLTFSKQEE